MSAIQLLHNPKCSKSRAALALLQERGATLEVRLYLEQPLDIGELATLARRVGQPVRGLVRTDEPDYTEAGLADAGLDDSAVLRALAAHPRLLQRPIAVRGERAVIGRPPENVLALL